MEARRTRMYRFHCRVEAWHMHAANLLRQQETYLGDQAFRVSSERQTERKALNRSANSRRSPGAENESRSGSPRGSERHTQGTLPAVQVDPSNILLDVTASIYTVVLRDI